MGQCILYYGSCRAALDIWSDVLSPTLMLLSSTLLRFSVCETEKERRETDCTKQPHSILKFCILFKIYIALIGRMINGDLLEKKRNKILMKNEI